MTTKTLTIEEMAARLQDNSRYDPETGCTVWTGYINMDGYGAFKAAGKMWRANRVSWMVHRGPIPAGLFACHHCDNRPCIDPNHLFLGTPGDNTADMIAKGRQRGATGLQNRHAKITEDDALLIVANCANGIWRPCDVMRRYEISRSHAGALARGEHWKHLPAMASP